jgi:hypothetical protein
MVVASAVVSVAFADSVAEAAATKLPFSSVLVVLSAAGFITG